MASKVHILIKNLNSVLLFLRHNKTGEEGVVNEENKL